MGLFLLGFLLLAGGLWAASSGDPSAEWAKSKHANRDAALAEATVESRGTTAAHCGRCHSQQGFVAWLPQLFAGNSGPIVQPSGAPADVAYLTSLGLTNDKVQPVTCTTCHGDGFALRVINDTPMLPAGFAAVGVGKGALCMTCHNTRNGRITWNTDDPKRYTAPHEAAQADVIMGKNSFFLDDTVERASAHALFTGDSCVTCHKTLGKEGHTFEPAENACTNCHGPAMTKEFVQKPTEELLAQVRVAVEGRVQSDSAKIKFVRAWDPATDKYTDDFAVDGTQVKRVEILSIHGQIGFKFTMADGSTVYSQLGSIKDAAGKAGNPVFATSNAVVRASWNYLLIEAGSALGVHNPRFTRDLLLATINAL